MQTMDRPASAMRSGSQAGLVGSCAHIDIPTAITPTVISAIQVSSLLFSANQSAIDEYAALLSLALCTAMTRLLQLPKGPPSVALAGPEGTRLVDESKRTIHFAAPVPPSRTKRSLLTLCWGSINLMLGVNPHFTSASKINLSPTSSCTSEPREIDLNPFGPFTLGYL